MPSAATIVASSAHIARAAARSPSLTAAAKARESSCGEVAIGSETLAGCTRGAPASGSAHRHKGASLIAWGHGHGRTQRIDTAAPGRDPRADEAARGLSLTRLRCRRAWRSSRRQMGAEGFWEDSERAAGSRGRARPRVAAAGGLQGARVRRRGPRRPRRDGRRGQLAAGRGRRADRLGGEAARRHRRSSGCSPGPTTPATRS